MILTIDVGNTAIGVAIFDKKGIVFRNKLLTPVEITEKYLKSLIKRKLLSTDDSIIISSVVPLIDNQIKSAVEKLFKITPFFVNYEMDLGFDIKIENPGELGADLIAGASGGLQFFKPPFIIVDSGTAITICGMDKNFDFVGGSIFPGIEMSIQGLSNNTAKLNKINFKAPESIIGKNTSDSIRSGIFYSCIGGIGHIISEYKKILGDNTKVIATGGLSRFFKNKIKEIDLYEPDLLFFGLKKLLEKNR